MSKYFYLKNNKKYGPCTIEELRKRSIDRDTMIWTEGMEEWLPVEEVPEIAEQLPPPVPNKGIAATMVSQLFPFGNIGDKILWIGVGMVILMLMIRNCR